MSERKGKKDEESGALEKLIEDGGKGQVMTGGACEKPYSLIVLSLEGRGQR